MVIIKRDGTETIFDKTKIVKAIEKANYEVEEIHKLNQAQINAISDYVETEISKFNHPLNVEDIQDIVEIGIMSMRGYEVAQKYVRYRYKKNLSRQNDSLFDGVLSMINLNNKEILEENSNKNPIIISTQRDYMAGEVSKYLTENRLLDKDILDANEEGIIHFHK